MRAMMSVLLPAGKGTTKRTGRSGHPSSPVWATAEAAATADANAIDNSRIIRKPRLRAPRRSAGAWSCLQCFDVRAIRSRLSAWTLQPIQARVPSSLRSRLLERGHTHATDRHFPARSCPRRRADGVAPVRQGARRPHRRLGQAGKPPALAPHDHGGFLARRYRARICRGHVEDRPPRGRVYQPRRGQARAPLRPELRTGQQTKKASIPQVPRAILADLIRGGAIVLICQPCLTEFGFKPDDVVPGVQLGSPGYLENFVFADNVRTLTW